MFQKIEVEFRGQKQWALCQKMGDTLWVHVGGRTYHFTDPSKRSRSSSKSAGDASQILAPMPGKIMKVLVEAGQSVSQGQTLVAMEAMKMEYNLKAEADGEVAEVRVRSDEQVQKDQLLVRLNIQQD